MSNSLPIYDLDEEIISSLRHEGRLIVQAPTGSGKSTQVPQILLDGGALPAGRCVILQPRRLAARMLAKRVAEERGVQLGAEVGYQIRLDNVSSPATRILFVTEGVLLRQILANPRLEGTSVLIFDEFHERHLYSDVTLSCALDLQASHRPDLGIIVMSATLDGARLESYLAPCQTLSSEGRMFPVEIEYLRHEPRDDEAPWERAAEAVAENFERTEGDVLIFMPGAYEIQRTIRELSHRAPSGCLVLPLHGELPASEQDKAVSRAGRRKIIVSTNVAETSLTIDGITMVVDAGLARVARYDPHRGINTLLIEKISRVSAEQRAGRAGRTAPGLCLRLWTERDHASRAATDLPEIRRLDLSETVLSLKAAGVRELTRFRWFDRPDEKSLARSEQLLADLGAIDHSGEITATGRRMQRFPVHPRYARMFLAAKEFGCVRAAALIAALTQSRNLLLRAERRVEEERSEVFGQGISDFLVLIRAFSYAERHNFRVDALRPLAIHAETARQVKKLFEQFLQIAGAEGLATDSGAAKDEAIARCVLAGFADQVARRRSGGTLLCDVVHGRRGQLARSSVAQNSRLIVAAEINEIEGRGGDAKVVLSLATQIEESWLREMFPDDFRERSAHFFDQTQRRVVIRREKIFRDLVIESQDRDADPSPEASAYLAQAVLNGELTLRHWDESVEQWIARASFLANALPEQNIPRIGPREREDLVRLACRDATSYREIKDRPILNLVRALLTPAQQQLLEKHAPERLELPGGSRAKITYPPDSPPFLSARIQDLYGVSGDLKIACGRVALVIHVLAPNHRPVQVTNSLKTFWAESYPKLKQTLQRQYPKHEWR